MGFRNFEEIEAWKVAAGLAVTAYPILCGIKDFSLRNQLVRSSFSISSNIAEGFGRKSNPAFRLFLQYSNGSACEFKSQLIIIQGMNLINENEFKKMIEQTNSCLKLIHKLHESLK